MPPENCAIGWSAASSRPNCSSSSLGGRAGLGASAGPEQAAEEPRGSRWPVRFSSTEAYWPVTPTSWRTHVRLAAHVDAEDLARRRASIGSSVASILQHRGLAGAVGAEDAEDLAAAHLEVDAVDGAQVAEGLDQAAWPGRPLL